MSWQMRWTQDQAAELARQWEGGFSAREIGRLLGISHNAVTSKRRRMGLPERPSPIPLSLGPEWEE